MATEAALALDGQSDDARDVALAPTDAARLRSLIDHHLGWIARSLRALGVDERDIEDATQQVFLIASRKVQKIEHGREGSFLFQTALRVAMHARRTWARRREVGDTDMTDQTDPAPTADALLDQRRARKLVDDVLETMAPELRAVLVLFEIEEKSTPEIAAMLDIPVGTAASRLRRAREEFRARVAKLRAREQQGGAR